MSHTLYPRVRDILKEAGYEVVRIGKHIRWEHPFTKNGISISHNIRDKNLARSLLRDAGLRDVKL